MTFSTLLIRTITNSNLYQRGGHFVFSSKVHGLVIFLVAVIKYTEKKTLKGKGFMAHSWRVLAVMMEKS